MSESQDLCVWTGEPGWPVARCVALTVTGTPCHRQLPAVAQPKPLKSYFDGLVAFTWTGTAVCTVATLGLGVVQVARWVLGV